MGSNNRETTFYKEVLPFAAMVTMECINVGLNTLYKAATNKGMSNHVFVVYSYGLAALLLLPSPFFSTRSRILPPLNCSILAKIFLLGVIGCTSQIMGYTGIIYASPTLASAISNLVPAFTFVLAVIFRMEKIQLKRSTTRAKVLGTVVSIAGAFVVTLYKGPKILVPTTSTPNLLRQPLSSSQSNWMLGGLFLTTEYFLVPMWYIVQTWIMKVYPAEVTVVFFYNLTVSILAAIVGYLSEPDSNKWIIKPDIALASILCSGILGSSLNNTIHTWALRVKGPVYVAMFKPLSIAIAVAMGVILLGDTLYLGSIVGATASLSYTVAFEDDRRGKTLNGAVMAFRKHSPFVMECLKESYDYTQLRWNGADLLTRIASNFSVNGNLSGRKREIKFQPSFVFFPIGHNNITRYFSAPAMETEKAEQDMLFKTIVKEAVTFHFWNGLTSAMVPEAGSLAHRLISYNCLRCSDTL